MVESKTFVLVAGSWLGGWYWREVAKLLRESGHCVYTPTLTGLAERSHLMNENVNLTTHIRDINNFIKWRELENIILCGHSYGGMVISGACEYLEQGIINSLVYVDAIYADSGLSLLDYMPLPPGVDPNALVVDPIPAEMFGLKNSVAERYKKLVTPHPLATWKEKLNLTGKIKEIPNKIFILATNSEIPLSSEMASKLQSEPDWAIDEITSRHLTAIDKPQETAEALIRASSA